MYYVLGEILTLCYLYESMPYRILTTFSIVVESAAMYLDKWNWRSGYNQPLSKSGK